jgi:hypothetical protein
MVITISFLDDDDKKSDLSGTSIDYTGNFAREGAVTDWFAGFDQTRVKSDFFN